MIDGAGELDGGVTLVVVAAHAIGAGATTGHGAHHHAIVHARQHAADGVIARTELNICLRGTNTLVVGAVFIGATTATIDRASIATVVVAGEHAAKGVVSATELSVALWRTLTLTRCGVADIRAHACAATDAVATLVFASATLIAGHTHGWRGALAFAGCGVADVIIGACAAHANVAAGVGHRATFVAHLADCIITNTLVVGAALIGATTATVDRAHLVAVVHRDDFAADGIVSGAELCVGLGLANRAGVVGHVAVVLAVAVATIDGANVTTIVWLCHRATLRAQSTAKNDVCLCSAFALPLHVAQFRRLACTT